MHRSSLDTLRQANLQRVVITNATSLQGNQYQTIANSASDTALDPALPTTPHCFVVDSDSTPYILDTGANRFIVNNARLLSNFVAIQGGVKGINGTSVSIIGQGTLSIHLPRPDGRQDTIQVEAVLVPSSPFNLIPPHLLVAALKHSGFRVKYFKHDDKQYVINYYTRRDVQRTIRIPLDDRNLFTFHSAPGFQNFCRQTSTVNKDWAAFPGATHIISDDLSLDGETLAPPSPTPSPPNPDTNLIPPDDISIATSVNSAASIPDAVSVDSQQAPPDTPVPTEFCTEIPDPLPPEDPNIAIYRRKQHRLLVLHERYGHLRFSVLRLLALSNLIPHELAGIDAPTCPGCAYGKAHRKPWRGKGIKNRRRILPATKPGQVVSIDQLESRTLGFVPTHRGTPTLSRYIGATIFVDHYSSFTYVHLMTEMNAATTVAAKQAFERLLHSYGVTVKSYHADNGLFDTKAFRANIQTSHQNLTFCGVNAHHQNGIAERRIKDITEGARTALLHAAHRWPQAISPALWPAALKHYVNTRNSLPSDFIPAVKTGRKTTRSAQFHGSPLSKLSGTTVEPNLRDLHPFGSPVYVLADKLQAVQSHNKWADRSRVGIFLCHSPEHASNVPLVLNTQTGNVSPQFHCLYDDAFDTCRRDAKFQSLWQLKAKLHLDARKPNNGSKLASPTGSLPNPASKEGVGPIAPRLVTPWDIPLLSPSVPQSIINSLPDPDPDPEPPDTNITPASEGAAPSIIPPTEGAASVTPHQNNPQTEGANHTPPTVTTRSGRRVIPSRRIYNADHYVPGLHAAAAYLSTFSPFRPPTAPTELLQPDIEALAEPHPYALICSQTFGLASKSSDPDTLTFDEAMQAPDRELFIEAMHKELNDHISRKHWKIVPLKSIPAGKRAIPMVWSMKRKRNPLGETIKHKSRLCAGGHRSIENVDYWNTYSPVVSWSTVRLIIVFALLNNWHMQSIDFVLAYPQAPIKTDIYLKPPRTPPGFIIPDLQRPGDRFLNVYKLLQNLYGLKDAGKTWGDYLKAGLIERGWKPSDIDSCLYTKAGIILIVYVDDAILISPSKPLIQKEISSLHKDYQLTDDGPLKDYLGTRFTRRDDGSVVLTQPHMVNRILQSVGLDPNNPDTKMHDTPADSRKILDNDPNGKRRTQKWNYRSVVGSLSYLRSIVRPDLTMAVQQCARFCNNPSREHEEAVKRICRYLLKTKDQGLVLRPDATRGLECHVDADFAGSWQHRSSDDPSSVLSRTGYVISYAGCPIICTSKLQTLTALSTTEAEYIALSSALREVISIMNLLKELKGRGFPIHDSTPHIKCRVFEDNQSCIEIATNHKTRPRTKHLSCRLHHFRSFVTNGEITIEHVSTTEQLADMFTKPLPRHQFRKLCDRLMGWAIERE